jgi:hypothetical protein
MNEPLRPSAVLVERTLARPAAPPSWRRAAAAALAAALLLATPALAARTEAGYELLYQFSPAMAQFFQPVQKSCTHRGITMKVAAVRVEVDTAQAYITLTGGPVDETTDLFDSWSFHLPFDQSGRCERLSWDSETSTITFLCTVQTLDDSPIPTGGKMTFSVRQLLTGKETLENAAVELELAAFTAEAETVPVDGPEDVYFLHWRKRRDGAGAPSMLLPGPALGGARPGPDCHRCRIFPRAVSRSVYRAMPPSWITTPGYGWKRRTAPSWILCTAPLLQPRIRRSVGIIHSSSLTFRRRSWPAIPSGRLLYRLRTD